MTDPTKSADQPADPLGEVLSRLGAARLALSDDNWSEADNLPSDNERPENQSRAESQGPSDVDVPEEPRIEDRDFLQGDIGLGGPTGPGRVFGTRLQPGSLGLSAMMTRGDADIPRFERRRPIKRQEEDECQGCLRDGTGFFAPEKPPVALSFDEQREDEEELEWESRQRQTGAAGRLVLYSEIDDPPHEDVKLRGGNGRRFVVTYVKIPGKAQHAGIKVGDVLVSIDGKKDFKRKSAESLLQSLKLPVTLVFMGFVGKLQAEVRLNHRQKNCGLSASHQVFSNASSLVQVVDEVVFQPEKAPIFIATGSTLGSDLSTKQPNPGPAPQWTAIMEQQRPLVDVVDPRSFFAPPESMQGTGRIVAAQGDFEESDAVQGDATVTVGTANVGAARLPPVEVWQNVFVRPRQRTGDAGADGSPSSTQLLATGSLDVATVTGGGADAAAGEGLKVDAASTTTPAEGGDINGGVPLCSQHESLPSTKTAGPGSAVPTMYELPRSHARAIVTAALNQLKFGQGWMPDYDVNVGLIPTTNPSFPREFSGNIVGPSGSPGSNFSDGLRLLAPKPKPGPTLGMPGLGEPVAMSSGASLFDSARRPREPHAQEASIGPFPDEIVSPLDERPGSPLNAHAIDLEDKEVPDIAAVLSSGGNDQLEQLQPVDVLQQQNLVQKTNVGTEDTISEADAELWRDAGVVLGSGGYVPTDFPIKTEQIGEDDRRRAFQVTEV